MRLLDRLRYQIGRHLPQAIRDRRGIVDWESLPSWGHLHALMSQYQLKDLVNVDRDSFRRKIDWFLRLQSYEMEGYGAPEKQRDLSIRFHWGHDHDFGDFALRGRMGSGHFGAVAAFVDLFGVLPLRLEGRRVLDIGCWTGGTSLLLCAMGARVTAIEEVKKYIECLGYMRDAFGLTRLDPLHMSLYDCTRADFQDAFDYVLFAGVLYHLSDPVLALRITFNCLRDGGYCLLSTAAIPARGRLLLYEGPTVYSGGNAADLSRSGWNWFTPSPACLVQMMADVGYQNNRVRRIRSGAGLRAFAAGRRTRHTDMCRAGVSVRTIR